MRQLNIVRGRSPQSDVETKRTKRETTGGGMREMVPKSFSFSDAFFQYSNGRIFSGSERLYITGTFKEPVEQRQNSFNRKKFLFRILSRNDVFHYF